MNNPCQEQKENVMRLLKKLKKSSRDKFAEPINANLSREEIHKLKGTLVQIDKTDEEFFQAAYELADCVRRNKDL